MYVLVAKYLECFSIRTPVGFNCLDSVLPECENTKTIKALNDKNNNRFNASRFYEMTIGYGTDRFNILVISKTHTNNILGLRLRLINELLLPTLRDMNPTSKTIKMNYIPETDIASNENHSIQIYSKAFQKFAEILSMKTENWVHEDNGESFEIFFYKYLHGLKQEDMVANKILVNSNLNQRNIHKLELV